MPLYLLDGRNTLLAGVDVPGAFTPCPSRPLPAKFKHGKKAAVCLVYFAPDHGKLTRSASGPTQDFDAHHLDAARSSAKAQQAEEARRRRAASRPVDHELAAQPVRADNRAHAR